MRVFGAAARSATNVSAFQRLDLPRHMRGTVPKLVAVDSEHVATWDGHQELRRGPRPALLRAGTIEMVIGGASRSNDRAQAPGREGPEAPHSPPATVRAPDRWR